MQVKDIIITKVSPEESKTLKNLLTLYLHDLSEFASDLDVNSEGLFEYDNIDLFWEIPELHAYFIKLDGKLAGFVFLTEPPYAPEDVNYCIHEFFVLKKYRRTGVGSAAINQIFALHPGHYKVLQLESNLPAIGFWHRFYANNTINYEELAFEMDGYPCLMQQFTV